MSASVAEYYEVQWRPVGSTENWSPSYRAAPTGEIVVSGLNRSTQYEFRVRSVSSCGARSVWVSDDHTVPDAPDGTLNLGDVGNAADAAMSSAIVRNPNFAKDASYWSYSTPADFYREDGTSNPNPYITTYLVHKGLAGKTYEYTTNLTYIPVRPGQIVVGIMCLRAFSVNAGATAAACINWYDSTNHFISASEATVVCGPGRDFLQGNSRLSVQAPANAAFATIGVVYRNHTAGYFNATTASLTPQVTSQDEVPDGKSYTRNVVQSGNAIVIPNANFEAPIGPSGEIPGWGAIYNGTLSYSATQVYAGAQSLKIVSGGANSGAQSPAFACSPGDTIFFRTRAFAESGGLATMAINFYSGNTFLSFLSVATTAYGGWQSPNGQAVAPAGATTFNIQLYNDINTGVSYFDDVLVVRQLNLANQVGGTLGTQKNLPLVTWGNYGGGWSGMGISYSTTTASCTFNASAANYVGGSDSISYNAGSVTVSGSAGSKVTYYLFYDDPGMTGGSKSLQATTSQITSLNSNGRVLVGTVTVTYPTSGTGGGTGSGGCPDENAWVLRADPDGACADWCERARDIEVGHYLRLSDGRTGRVTYSQRKASPRVRVTGDHGHALTCSPSAPLELAAGGHGDCVPARSSLAATVRILGPVPALATRIASVEPMADGYVQHITCENACFWTGDEPEYLFAHHNRKPDAP